MVCALGEWKQWGRPEGEIDQTGLMMYKERKKLAGWENSGQKRMGVYTRGYNLAGKYCCGNYGCR